MNRRVFSQSAISGTMVCAMASAYDALLITSAARTPPQFTQGTGYNLSPLARLVPMSLTRGQVQLSFH